MVYRYSNTKKHSKDTASITRKFQSSRMGKSVLVRQKVTARSWLFRKSVVCISLRAKSRTKPVPVSIAKDQGYHIQLAIPPTRFQKKSSGFEDDGQPSAYIVPTKTFPRNKNLSQPSCILLLIMGLKSPFFGRMRKMEGTGDLGADGAIFWADEEIGRDRCFRGLNFRKPLSY